MRVIVFTGRGGSGVSTLAAATAAALAESGKRTLAFGLGRGLGDLLGTPLTHEASEVAERLFGIETGHGDDEPDEFRDWLEDMFDWRGVDVELAEDLTALPGANLIGRMLNLAQEVEEGDYEVVVVDGLPLEQHLDVPGSLDAAARWLDRLFEPRQANVLEPFVRMFAADYASAGEEILESGREFLGRLAELRDLLTDPSVTTARLVLRPDASAIADTKSALTALRLFSHAVDALVLNRLLPEAVTDDFFGDARSEQAAATVGIEALTDGMPVLRAQLSSWTPRGLEDLKGLAGELYSDRDPGAVLHRTSSHSFERGDGGYVMTLTLPHAQRKELAVEQLEDGVAVHVNGRRCVLSLPDEVVEREAASWSFEPPLLKVTFKR
jgi:arsenite/tail-anchored protein-transporting ATPase